MLKVTDIIKYYAQFVSDETIGKLVKSANKTPEYLELLQSIQSGDQTNHISSIDNFIVSIDEKRVADQMRNSKGRILFVEYGGITMHGDVVQKANIDIAISVASNCTVSTSDMFSEALIMEENLRILNKIIDQMALDASTSSCLKHITFPATIMPIQSKSFYDNIGWVAMFKRSE